MKLDEKRVYLVDTPSFTKIGISVNPESRTDKIRTANPTQVALANVIHTTDAKSLEELLHDILRDFQTSGEWFDLPSEIHDTLCEAVYLTPETIERRLDRYDVTNPQLYQTEIMDDRLANEHQNLYQKCRSTNSMVENRSNDNNDTECEISCPVCTEYNERADAALKDSITDQMDYFAELHAGLICIKCYRKYHTQ